MDKRSESTANAEAREKAEAKMARLLALIFGSVIVVLIAGMAAIDIYAEKLQGSQTNVHDAAEQ